MIKYENWHLKMFLKQGSLVYFEQVLEEKASALLTSKVESGPQKGKWLFEAIFRDRPDMQELDSILGAASSMAGVEVPDYSISALPDKNWLKDSLLSFPPVNIGCFYIYGSHIKIKSPKGKLALKIDAATAFGSGEHPTTEGCVRALCDLHIKGERPKKILDMGCGSGILSLASAVLFKVPVWSVDIDEEAEKMTRDNAKENKLDQYIQAKKGNGYRSNFVKDNAPFDVILANILANPLRRMAPSLEKNLAKGGVAVLSGLLQTQEKSVVNAHTKLGLNVERVYHIGEWSAVVLRKNKK